MIKNMTTYKINTEGRLKLFQKYEPFLINDPLITRKTVSFQANKDKVFYRWFKYKEGFSSNLVQYYIKKYGYEGQTILDPFSGVGTTLFAASELNCSAIGIELLPVGPFVIEARQRTETIDYQKLKSIVLNLWSQVDQIKNPSVFVKHIRITDGAFPPESEHDLNKFLTYAETLGADYTIILKFVVLAVLEDISYTRKDGQYLRWDYRSGRSQGKIKFDKGKIYAFRQAVNLKLNEILNDLKLDLNLFEKANRRLGKIINHQDSCLTKLSEFASNSIDCVITSPPYCNRYDYTRTYALELILLGCDHEKIKKLRQAMLSCTVENKSKIESIKHFYKKNNRQDSFTKVLNIVENSAAVNEILDILNHYKSIQKLNNNAIPRMIQNYFYEMAFTIFELARIIRKEGRIVMVNDNVQYAGEEIPVDLILSDFAEQFGLKIENIVTLQQKKGNSSQQMGDHGRNPIRKCVYIWQKL